MEYHVGWALVGPDFDPPNETWTRYFPLVYRSREEAEADLGDPIYAMRVVEVVFREG